LCTQFGYTTSAPWYSSSSTLSAAIGYNTVYSDTNYTVFNGDNLWYAVTTNDTFNTATGGQFNAIQIGDDGIIVATGLKDCSSPNQGGGQT
jgi:hypothetical protein